ncbi:DUF3330 domain-containing protein, partial [Acinetobacter baumannii]|uniref:DUF3330 domain-containing protein n=1 Tax=Acinetobacter baumannii TaxID=470 RepID=UPI0038B6AD5B
HVQLHQQKGMISLSPPTICNSARNTTMNANEPSTSCCVCCKEIPLDAAFTPEGAEYVEHFCGLECYQRFQARASTATETSVKPDACDSPPSG